VTPEFDPIALPRVSAVGFPGGIGHPCRELYGQTGAQFGHGTEAEYVVAIDQNR
jgi:hypothetical protein